MSGLYSFLLFSYVIWLFSIFFLSFSAKNDKTYLIQFLSLSFSLIQFLTVLFFWVFNSCLEVGSFDLGWMFFYNFHYYIKLDAVSILFLLLSYAIIFVCFLISWNSIKYKYAFFATVLVSISFFLFNIFCTFDLVFFYIFFESILIPMFLLIGVWGSRQRKIHAVYQFFFYTIFGSLLLLLSILFVYSYTQTTDINLLCSTYFPINRQLVLWFCFFFAFAVKVPMFPFHIWLPEAHVEAPTIGSVILAGVLLKMGSYGMFRFVIPLFCEATYFFVPLIYTFCVLGIIYTCLTTIRQIDLKKIIAYSSVSHMSFVLLGLFSTSPIGIVGSLFLMLSHGIVSSGLFFCIGCLYDRYKTRVLRYFSGLVNVMPLFGCGFFFLILSNISFPGTSNFVGEFMVLLGLYNDNIFVALVSTFSIILTAIYSVWLYNRLMFGRLQVNYVTIFQDVSKREFYTLGLFCSLALLFGLKPNILLSLLDYSVYYFVQFK